MNQRFISFLFNFVQSVKAQLFEIVLNTFSDSYKYCIHVGIRTIIS